MTQESQYAGFRLIKWYLDCVSADGEAVIAYWARVSWRGFGLAYAGLLHRSAGGDVSTSWTLWSGRGPMRTPGGVRWSRGALGLRGDWQARLQPVQKELWQSPGGGRVLWECIAPAANVKLQSRRGGLDGLGYVERIELTIPPWRLPIHELRWGRWIGASRSVVWVDWRGDHPLTLILRNGAETSGRVHDDSIGLDGGTRLSLTREGILRSGQLGATVLGAIPVVRSAVPASIMDTQEDKWIGRGVLMGEDGSGEEGWAIHEIVRFGQERA